MPNTFSASISAGITDARRHPRLALLLYGVNLAGALLLGTLVYGVLVDTIGITGFGDQKLRDFDYLLWQEVMLMSDRGLTGLAVHLLWLIPLYLLWRVIAGAGLVYALHQGGGWSFWKGVRRYAPRAFVLALVWLPFRLLVVGGVALGAAGLAAVWEGEIGTFWTWFVLLPTGLIAGLAVVDLFERYGRLALIIRHERAMSAFATGLVWPFRHGMASWLYIFWFLIALAVLLIPNVIGASGATSTAAIWGAFLSQQVFLFLRALLTVTWTGSEVALFESLWMTPSSSPQPELRPAIA